jgi:hypothetical protein
MKFTASIICAIVVSFPAVAADVTAAPLTYPAEECSRQSDPKFSGAERALIARATAAIEERYKTTFEACYIISNWGKGTIVTAQFIHGYRDGKPLLHRSSNSSAHFNSAGELTEVSGGR